MLVPFILLLSSCNTVNNDELEDLDSIEELESSIFKLNQENQDLLAQVDELTDVIESYRPIEGNKDTTNIFFGYNYWGEYNLTDNQYRYFARDKYYEPDEGLYSFYYSNVNGYEYITTVDVNDFNSMTPYRGSSIVLRNNPVAAHIETTEADVSDYYEQIRTVLDNNGLENTPLKLMKAWKLDVDGDKEMEVLIHASNIPGLNPNSRFPNYVDESLELDGVGAYEIIVLIYDDQSMILFGMMENTDSLFQRMTSEELYEMSLKEHLSSEYLYALSEQLYLFDEEGNIQSYSLPIPGEVIWNSKVYNLGILDIDMDGLPEIVFSAKGGYGHDYIVDYSEGEIMIHQGEMHD